MGIVDNGNPFLPDAVAERVGERVVGRSGIEPTPQDRQENKPVYEKP